MAPLPCERRPCGEVGRAVSFDNADRLPVVVRFPAGPQVSLKVGDQPKGRWRRPKKKKAPLPCENTSAAWQLFFTARTCVKPHRLDSSSLGRYASVYSLF